MDVQRECIFRYVKEQYGTVPEYLWKTSPSSAVLRHGNGKWYGIIMSIETSRLGIEGDSVIDIIKVRPGNGGAFDTDKGVSAGVPYE